MFGESFRGINEITAKINGLFRLLKYTHVT